MSKKVIAVTGMGLCGNAVFCRLVRLFAQEKYRNQEIRILLFEQNPHYFATGLAYSIDSPHYWTLNNPAAGFKFIAENESLTSWMTNNEDALKAQYPEADWQYVPRAMVGQYLKAQYKKHKELAHSLGITIEEIPTSVSDVNVIENERYEIMCGEQRYLTDALFLTTGHLGTPTFKHLEGKPGFMRFEQLLLHQVALDLSNDVCIIGGQGAFIDTTLWLTKKQKYKGVIHSVTRSPSALTTKGNEDVSDTKALQTLYNELREQSKGSLTYVHAKAAFWRAYNQDAKEPIDDKAIPGTYQALSYQMNKFYKQSVESSNLGNVDELRAFIKNFYFGGCYKAMWDSLNDEGKVEFQKCFYSFLMAYLTGTTPINARALLYFYETNQIKEHTDLKSVSFDEERQEYCLSFDSGETLYCKTLIDSSGYSYKPDPNQESTMLLDILAKKGLIVALNHGGIQLTEQSQVIDKDEVTHTTLFCVGPIARYNHPVPTPYSSFMVEQDVEVVVKQLASVFEAMSSRVFSFTT